MKLTKEQRRALILLADAGPRGITEALMIDAHGFTIELLVSVHSPSNLQRTREVR